MRHTRARDRRRRLSSRSLRRRIFLPSHAPRVRLVRVRVTASRRDASQTLFWKSSRARDPGTAASRRASTRGDDGRDRGGRRWKRVVGRHRPRASPRREAREQRRGIVIPDDARGDRGDRDVGARGDFGSVDDAEDARGGEARAGEEIGVRAKRAESSRSIGQRVVVGRDAGFLLYVLCARARGRMNAPRAAPRPREPALSGQRVCNN